jgi:hypothetical protein
MFVDKSNTENLSQVNNLNAIEKGVGEEFEECLYSTITPFKSKEKLFNNNLSTNENDTCLQIRSQCCMDNDYPENTKKIAFNTYNKDDYENPHDYYSILADSFNQSEQMNNKNNARSHSLNHLDQIKRNKAKHSISYKNKFFSVNNKLRIKFRRLNLSNSKPLVLERLIRKNGEVNINRVHIASRHLKYISDLFNTVIGKYFEIFPLQCELSLAKIPGFKNLNLNFVLQNFSAIFMLFVFRT